MNTYRRILGSFRKSFNTADGFAALVLIIPITGLLMGIAYMFTFEQTFPNYQGLEEPVQISTEEAYALPGDEVQLPLNERAIARHHTIRNASVTYLGEQLPITWLSGVDNGLLSSPDDITYQDREAIKEYDGVGSISFEIPDDPALYGQTITVSYKAEFRFPIVLKYNTFKWGSRNISSDFRIKIGSREQERSIQKLGYVFLVSWPLLIFIAFSIFVTIDIYRARKAEL